MRDAFASCPRCRSGLDARPDARRLECGTCNGVLVSDAHALELVGTMLAAEHRPTVLTILPTAAWPTICPCCTAAMESGTLYGINVDRCERHGLWFDAGRLVAMLEAAGTAAPPSAYDRLAKVTAIATSVVLVGLHILRYIAMA